MPSVGTSGSGREAPSQRCVRVFLGPVGQSRRHEPSPCWRRLSYVKKPSMSAPPSACEKIHKWVRPLHRHPKKAEVHEL